MVTDSKPNSYDQILRSSSVIGGSAGIGILLALVRIKVAAILLGPIGVGLIATYQAVQGVVGVIAGLGIQQSAVREIAAAVGRGDCEGVGRTVLSLRRICWLTGFFGLFAMAVLALPLSQYTFDSQEYALDIACLGPIILFASIQGGQLALLQGMRRIGDLARLNVIGSALGVLVTVAFYASLGIRGIVPSLVAVAFIQLIITWHFSRKLNLHVVTMSWKESFQAAHGLIRLGLVFMWSGLTASIVAYLTRAWISQDYDLLAVGIFTAAFSLSGMFINFILGAMSADYYPRLTEVSHSQDDMRRLVNEQTEIGLLLAVPGLLATLTLAPWIIRVFYTSEFLPAADLLQWFILGCLGRVISWPLSMVMLALSKSRWYFLTETAFNLLHVGMVWGGLVAFGVEGVAIAFFILYVFYTVAVFSVARKLIAFVWTESTLRLLSMTLPMVAFAFLAARFLPLPISTFMGLVGTFAVSLVCLRGLVQRLGYGNKIVQMSFRMPGVRWVCEL